MVFKYVAKEMKMKLLKILFLVACVVCTFVGFAYSQKTGTERGIDLPVKMWVENTADNLIKSVALQNTDVRFSHLRNIFRDSVDVNYIARKVIGRNWRSFDANIRERYVDAFENYLLYAYAAKPINLNVTDFSVTGTRSIASSDVVIVSATANFMFMGDASPQPRKIDFTFTVSGNADDFKILDISVGGVSAVNFLSGFYASQLSKNGGDAYYTLRQLEAEVRRLQEKDTLGEEIEVPFSALPEKEENSPDYIQPDLAPYVQ